MKIEGVVVAMISEYPFKVKSSGAKRRIGLRLSLIPLLCVTGLYTRTPPVVFKNCIQNAVFRFVTC